MKGYAFHVGCEVVRAVMSCGKPRLELSKVTLIKDNKIYLNNSKQPIRCPKRLLIIGHDPLYKMIKDYELVKND
jgi:uncharacterized pyridoxamine 5'-phosphate oxidase family protein